MGCELGSQSCKPGSLPKIPLFTGIPVGYGGIWWDSGEIWTGIPVGCVLGSRWDMVGYGLGSRLDVYWDPGWMFTGIPVGYGGIWTGIPVNVDWDPYQISQWDRGRDPSGIPVGIPVLFSLGRVLDGGGP